MKTQVIMKRELFGSEISQQSKSEFFSATDLVRAGNKLRISEGKNPISLGNYFRSVPATELVETLQKEFGTVVITGRGRNAHTWVHPFIFIDLAMTISVDFKVEAIRWVYDHLLAYRNDSGDSYKRMVGALYVKHSSREFPEFISKVGKYIRDKVGVADWQSATEKQLRIRDKIHLSIETLSNVLTDTREAVRLGVKQHEKEIQNLKS